MLSAEEEVGDMLNGIQLSPGGCFELPYGFKIESFEPKDEPQNFERALRWQLMAVCAAARVPPHEVTGDWSVIPERMARYVGQGMERRAEVEQSTLEHQLVDPMWKSFVDHVAEANLWEPLADVDMVYAYYVEWEWLLLPFASFRQVLAMMMQVEEKGIVSKSYVTKTMFGLDPAAVEPERVQENARRLALGIKNEKVAWETDTPVAQAYADGAVAVEEEDYSLLY